MTRQTENLTRQTQAALDNPDLPIDFIKELYIALGEKPESKTLFVPLSKLKEPQQ